MISCGRFSHARVTTIGGAKWKEKQKSIGQSVKWKGTGKEGDCDPRKSTAAADGWDDIYSVVVRCKHDMLPNVDDDGTNSGPNAGPLNVRTGERSRNLA